MQLTVDRFYRLAREGKLVGLRCEQGHFTVPPRPSCRVCLSMKLETTELSGKGQVISFTEVYVKSKDFPLETPYILALVRLEEGGNLLGVFNGTMSQLSYGTEVQAKFRNARENDRWPRIFFEPSS